MCESDDDERRMRAEKNNHDVDENFISAHVKGVKSVCMYVCV